MRNFTRHKNIKIKVAGKTWVSTFAFWQQVINVFLDKQTATQIRGGPLPTWHQDGNGRHEHTCGSFSDCLLLEVKRLLSVFLTDCRGAFSKSGAKRRDGEREKRKTSKRIRETQLGRKKSPRNVKNLQGNKGSCYCCCLVTVWVGDGLLVSLVSGWGVQHNRHSHRLLSGRTWCQTCTQCCY